MAVSVRPFSRLQRIQEVLYGAAGIVFVELHCPSVHYVEKYTIYGNVTGGGPP